MRPLLLIPLLLVGQVPDPPPEWETVRIVYTTEVTFHPTTGRWLLPTSTVVGWWRPETGYHGGLPAERWPTGAPVTRENLERILEVQTRFHATVSGWLHGEAPKWWPEPRVNR